MESRQQQDLELWRQWKKSKSPRDLNKLLDRLQPLIYREVSKWKSAVPPAALESKARMLTVEALDNYNPNRGAAIGTHVTARLRKLSRSVYSQQNVVRLPENKQLLYNTYNIANTSLNEELGRDPTVNELADHLAWTPKKVKDFQKSFGRRELVESEGAYLESDERDDMLTHFFYNDLNQDDKRMFEDITGYGGRRVLNNSQLRKKYKLTQGQLSHRKSKFVKRLKDIQKGRV